MTKEPFPSDKQDKFMLRLPDGMRDNLKALAAFNHRSLNAEILARLESSLGDPVSNQLEFVSQMLASALKNPESQVQVLFSTAPPSEDDQKIWVRRLSLRFSDGTGVTVPSPSLDASNGKDLGNE